jgi:hypothetical protein
MKELRPNTEDLPPTLYADLGFLDDATPRQAVTYTGHLRHAANTQGGHWKDRYLDFIHALALYPMDSQLEPEAAFNLYSTFAGDNDPENAQTILPLLSELQQYNASAAATVLGICMTRPGQTAGDEAVREAAIGYKDQQLDTGGTLYFLPRPANAAF